MSLLTVSCWSICTLFVGIETIPRPLALSSKSLSGNVVAMVLFSIKISPSLNESAVIVVVTVKSLIVAVPLTVKFWSIKTSLLGI